MRSAMGRLSRAFCLLGALLGGLAGLAGCVAQPGQYGYAPPVIVGVPPPVAVGPSAPASTGRQIAILLPLTGPSAGVGQSMLKAAQLALRPNGAPPLASQDTGGTPDGAARAARAAIAGGAGILLGPLTAPETAAVAPIARAAGVPVLAFTSDTAQAQPGVWTLGITPGQQVRRLVAAVQGEGRGRIAAVLPGNAFGDALGAGLLAAATEARLPPPLVVRQSPGPSGLTDALTQLASSTGLHGPGDAAAAPEPARIDALLLGTSGEPLAAALPTLAAYQTGADHLRLLGTALWAREAPRLFLIAGAWFAAPDPAPLSTFEQQYSARYGGPPREYAGLAFDAAAAAQFVASPAGFPIERLTRAEGFSGAEGLFALQPDGQVRRGLALFEIDHTGAHVVQPGRQSLASTGS